MSKCHMIRVCCSDGFITKPDFIRGNVIHEIRNPGGILFPNLYARDEGGQDPIVVAELLRIGDGILSKNIDTMVGLKSPSRIILQAHAPCAAAKILGLNLEDVNSIHKQWEFRLRNRYPKIKVDTWFEEHSTCGNHRKEHVQVETPMIIGD